MAFSDSSDAQVGFLEETVFGTTDATPVWQLARFTGESLNYNIENVKSDEIRSDAEVSDVIPTAANAGGDVQFELSKGPDMDTLLEHALRNDFATDDLLGGTMLKSLSVEKLLTAGSSDFYFRYTGCRVSQMQLSVQAGSILTGSFGIQGLASTTDTAIVTGATYTESNTNDVMTAVDVGTITIGGTLSTLFFTDMSFTLNNNTRVRPAVGSLGAVGIGYGRREISGTLTAYFEDQAIYDQFVAGAASSIEFVATDGTNSYTITFPKIKYTTGSVVAGGNNTDIFATMTWEAMVDTTVGSSIKMVKTA